MENNFDPYFKKMLNINNNNKSDINIGKNKNIDDFYEKNDFLNSSSSAVSIINMNSFENNSFKKRKYSLFVPASRLLSRKKSSNNFFDNSFFDEQKIVLKENQKFFSSFSEKFDYNQTNNINVIDLPPVILPSNVWKFIFSFIDKKDVLNCSLLSKKFNLIAKSCINQVKKKKKILFILFLIFFNFFFFFYLFFFNFFFFFFF